MALQPESLPALEDALAKAAAWQARAARLFKDGELTVPFCLTQLGQSIADGCGRPCAAGPLSLHGVFDIARASAD